MQTTKSVSQSQVIPYAWVILAVAYFASVVAPLNQFKVPPIMPVLLETFGVSLSQGGLLMSIIAVIGLVLALPAGIIVQRLGLKTTGVIALGCLAAGAAVGALAGGFTGLLAGRVVEGIGIGLISVVAPAAIAQWFPPDRQGAPMGIWATWVPVGTVVIYNLAPAMTAALGWQSVWWLGAGYGAVMLAAYALLMRRPPQAEPPARPAAGAPTEDLSLRAALKNRNIWLIALAFACFNLVFVAFGTYYPTFLNEVRGYPLGQAAFIASIGTSVVLVSAPLAGVLSDRINSRRLVMSLPFLGMGLVFLLPFTVTGWQIPALMLVQGAVAGAVPVATFAAAPEVMRKPQWAGLGLAVVLVGQNLGQLIGPLLFGELVKPLGWAVTGYLLVPVCVLGFFAAWKVKIR